VTTFGNRLGTWRRLAVPTLLVFVCLGLLPQAALAGSWPHDWGQSGGACVIAGCKIHSTSNVEIRVNRLRNEGDPDEHVSNVYSLRGSVKQTKYRLRVYSNGSAVTKRVSAKKFAGAAKSNPYYGWVKWKWAKGAHGKRYRKVTEVGLDYTVG
jgi:hypothetical protein